MKTYRVFVTIEEEDDKFDTYSMIDETCLGTFDNLKDAQELAQTIEDTHLS